MKVFKSILPYLIIIALVVLLVVALQNYLSNNTLTMTELVKQLDANNVQSVELEKFTAKVKLKNPIKESETKEYKVTVISYDKFEELMIEASRKNEDFNYKAIVKELPFIVTILPYILMVLVFGFFIFIFLNQGNAGANKVLNFGKNRARIYTTSKISFADVAGADEEKEELMELVSFLKDPKRYASLGARIPKGVLMIGPPGTGKTYLAKAVAGEAGVPFFSISGSDFVEMYVGVGASRVRDLFEQAKKNSPCIIFIDEIDAVGRHRGAGLGGGHDEREQTLNQLLVEMDGFGVNEGVIMIAATNRPDILDPALTRPGRFDRKITVGYPDIRARELVLKVHSKNKPLAEDVNFSDVAKNTSGFTAADLENLMNEAALLAARNKKSEISSEDIKEATFKVIIGPEKRSLVMTEDDKRLTALHEAGHAIAVKVASSTNKVDRISIIPTGMAGGYTASRPEEDRDYVTKSQLEEEIIVALAGKAAEDIVLNEVSTGSSSDLKRANSIALNMVAKYGMSDELGNMIVDTGAHEVFMGRDLASNRSVSEETSAMVDKEVRKIIDKAYKKAIEILKDNMEKLHQLADRLLEVEKIEREEFEEIMAT